MRENKGKRGALLAAVALLTGAEAGWGAITYDSSSRIRLTHDADISNAGDTPVTTGNIPVQKSIDIFPVNPYQLENTFTSGSANTIAAGSLGRLTNPTTATFVLATGTGVTQTDPINAYPGKSSLKFDVDLKWDVTSGGFGPLANGFATLNTGVVVGAGGSAELHINLEFLNQNGARLRSPWIVDNVWPAAGTFTDTFSTARALGSGSLPAGSKLRILGTIEFLASNADSPSSFFVPRAEFGGTPPTGVWLMDASGVYTDRNWEQASPNPNEPGLLSLPGGVGQRAWFAGTAQQQFHSVFIPDNVTLGTMDIDSPTTYQFSGNAPITWAAQQGEAVLNVRQIDGSHSMELPFILNSNLNAIVEGKSRLQLDGPISGSQQVVKLGAGTLILGGNNTYTGQTTVEEGTLLVNTEQGSATGDGLVSVNTGATLGGNGHIAGMVAAKSLAHIAPGGSNGIGTLTVGGLNLQEGSIIEIEGVGSSFDGIFIVGTQTHTFSDSRVNLSPMGSLFAGNYPLIQYNGEPLGSLNGKLSLVERLHGNTWATLFDNPSTTTVMLNLTQIPQWNVDGNGSWGTTGNWSPAIVPAGAAGIAGFLGKITAPRTVSLDGARTVGTIVFDNPNRYAIASGLNGSLTVGDPANAGTIQVATGNHQIFAPLTFAGNTEINIANGQSLLLGSATRISANQTLIKTGPGTLHINGSQQHGAGARLDVNGGIVNLNSNPGVAGSAANSPLALSINGSSVVLGASVDMKELAVNHGNAGSQTLDLNSPVSGGGLFRTVTVYSANLDAAKASLWDAIANANRPGAADPLDGIIDSHLHPNSGIGLGKISDHILIRPTRIGDVNLDGTVTISDFIDLASHFNTLGTATWQEGDMNYDKNVTIADFIDLASNFNSSYAGETWPISAADAKVLADFAEAHGAAVPEPAGIGSLLLAIVSLQRRRRGR